MDCLRQVRDRPTEVVVHANPVLSEIVEGMVKITESPE